MKVKDRIREMLEADPTERVARQMEDFISITNQTGEQLQTSIALAFQAIANGELELAAVKFAECSILTSHLAEIRRTVQAIAPVVENLEKLQIKN